jgi:hypothetical protein
VQRHCCEFPQHLFGKDAFTNQSAANQTARDGLLPLVFGIPRIDQNVRIEEKTSNSGETGLPVLLRACGCCIGGLPTEEFSGWPEKRAVRSCTLRADKKRDRLKRKT